MKRAVLVSSLLTSLLTVGLVTSVADAFEYRPAGELVAGSGKGRVDTKIYVPGMRFPIEVGPAYPNSQVWGVGGSQGPGGGQCDARNYSYPWRDNYCESRSWDMPLCPSGTGHQGQDIRASTCAKDVHWAVAGAAGTITNVGSYSVYLTAADGTRFDYLHMSNVTVTVGAKVTRGQRLGKVSNVFGGTPTTIHLHFNLRQNIAGVGTVYVPPYMSLVSSYEALIGPPPDVNDVPKGQLDAASCDELRGWAQDPDVADKPIGVHVYVDGKPGDVAAKVLRLTAATKRDDLCVPLGSCEHGFTSPLPLSLKDGKPHEIRAFAIDSAGGPNAELAGGPKTVTCGVIVPEGVRRHVTTTQAYASWNFDPLWNQITVDDARLTALAKGKDLPAAPKVVKANDDSPEIWLLDSGYRRHISSPDVMVAWELDGTSVELMPAAEIAALPKGPDVRSAPFLVKGAGPEVYLVDDPFAATTGADAGLADDAGLGADAGTPALEPAADGASDVQGSCACDLSARTNGTASTGLAFALVMLLSRRRRR